MAPVEQLDTKYGATKQEREYVQEMLEKKEGVIGLFKKELNKLNTKIIRNFHSDNFVAFEAQKKFETEKKSMKDIIKDDSDMQKKYEEALHKKRSGFSEGILLVQAIAIKCVEKINSTESVANKLTSRNGSSFKSQAMDGILGPNTFYVLASIAKEKKIPFNGIIDKPLLDAMIKICGGTPAKPTDIAPAKPTDAAPAKPTDAAPAKPADVAPVKPTDVAPAKPTDIAPVKPTDVAPVKPTDVAPAKPTDVAPAKTPEPPKDKSNTVSETTNPINTAPVAPEALETQNIDFLKYKMKLLRLKLTMNKKKGFFEHSDYSKNEPLESTDKQKKFYSIYENRDKDKKIMDIGFFSAGPDKGKFYIGLDDYIYQKIDKFDDKFDDIVSNREKITQDIKEATTPAS